MKQRAIFYSKLVSTIVRFFIIISSHLLLLLHILPPPTTNFGHTTCGDPEYIGLRPTITNANPSAAVAAVRRNPITVTTAGLQSTPPTLPPCRGRRSPLSPPYILLSSCDVIPRVVSFKNGRFRSEAELWLLQLSGVSFICLCLF